MSEDQALSEAKREISEGSKYHPSKHLYTVHKTYTGEHCAICGQPRDAHALAADGMEGK